MICFFTPPPQTVIQVNDVCRDGSFITMLLHHVYMVKRSSLRVLKNTLQWFCQKKQTKNNRRKKEKKKERLVGGPSWIEPTSKILSIAPLTSKENPQWLRWLTKTIPTNTHCGRANCWEGSLKLLVHNKLMTTTKKHQVDDVQVLLYW